MVIPPLLQKKLYQHKEDKIDMISIGEWLSDEIDNGYDVTTIPSFYIDTETLRECCLYVDTLGRNVIMGYEVSPLEKLGFHVIASHLGYKTSEEVSIAYKEFLEECREYSEGISSNKNSPDTTTRGGKIEG